MFRSGAAVQHIKEGQSTTPSLTCLIRLRFGMLRLRTAYLFRRCASTPALTGT
jgi:hypothetical protein